MNSGFGVGSWQDMNLLKPEQYFELLRFLVLFAHLLLSFLSRVNSTLSDTAHVYLGGGRLTIFSLESRRSLRNPFNHLSIYENTATLNTWYLVRTPS